MLKKDKARIGIPIEFKIEKLCKLENGGNYLFAITSETPLNNEMILNLKEAIEAVSEQLLRDFEVKAKFIVIDNGLTVEILQNGDIKKAIKKYECKIEEIK